MNSNSPVSDRTSKRSLTPRVRRAIPLPTIANGEVVDDASDTIEVEEIEKDEVEEEQDFEDEQIRNLNTDIENEKANLKAVRDLMVVMKENEEAIKSAIQEFNNAKSAYKRAKLSVRARSNGNA